MRLPPQSKIFTKKKIATGSLIKRLLLGSCRRARMQSLINESQKLHSQLHTQLTRILQPREDQR